MDRPIDLLTCPPLTRIPWGILLHPAVGAILMSMSTVIVAANAQQLRRAEL